MESWRTNVDGTMSLLEAARLAGTKRLVFASSVAVYAGRDQLPQKEGLSSLDPASPYAVQKIIGEMLCRLHREAGPETVSLRISNVYGPRQVSRSPHNDVVAIFASALLQGSSLDIYGDGVNVAARLQEHAEPGGVLISESVHDVVRGTVGKLARDIGYLQLKNLDKPVRAYLAEMKRG